MSVGAIGGRTVDGEPEPQVLSLVRWLAVNLNLPDGDGGISSTTSHVTSNVESPCAAISAVTRRRTSSLYRAAGTRRTRAGSPSPGRPGSVASARGHRAPSRATRALGQLPRTRDEDGRVHVE